jgi:hypothetical protein
MIIIQIKKGIPLHLLPNMNKSKEVNFVVHWMNNKDFHFTYEAENFSREIYDRIRRMQHEKFMSKKGSENVSNNDDNFSESINGTHLNLFRLMIILNEVSILILIKIFKT